MNRRDSYAEPPGRARRLVKYSSKRTTSTGTRMPPTGSVPLNRDASALAGGTSGPSHLATRDAVDLYESEVYHPVVPLSNARANHLFSLS